jgi:hypothetical protein
MKIKSPATLPTYAPSTNQIKQTRVNLQSNVSSVNIATSVPKPTISSILKGYDFKSISWNEVQTIGKKLYDAGYLTGDQLCDFTQPLNISIDMKTFQTHIDGDQKYNFNELLASQISFLNQHGYKKAADNLVQTQDVLLSLEKQQS